MQVFACKYIGKHLLAQILFEEFKIGCMGWNFVCRMELWTIPKTAQVIRIKVTCRGQKLKAGR